MQIQLDALSTNAGFLKNARIEFAPGLTCIIGARGTCKSTVVESIRFAFDCDAQKIEKLCAPEGRSDQRPSNAGMIRATLKSGIAKCHVTAIGSDGHHEISIEREVDARPSVFRNGIEELTDHGVLHMVEIYSQGDLQRIAHDESLRMELIDRPNKLAIADFDRQRKEFAEQLKDVGEAIRKKNRDIESRQADVRGVDGVQQQLSELQAGRPQLSAELSQKRKEAEQRTSILDVAKRRASESMELVQKVRVAIESQTDFTEVVELLRVNADVVSQKLLKSFQEIGRMRSEIQRCVDNVRLEELEDSISELQNLFEKKNQRYYELRREQEEVNDSLKKEDGLKKQMRYNRKLCSMR